MEILKLDKMLFSTKKNFPIGILFCTVFTMASTGWIHARPSGFEPGKEGNEPGKERTEVLIYENSFDKNQEEWLVEMAEKWVMEGKGIAECNDGYLSMRSEIYTVPRDKDGHFNIWLKEDFPANVAFEWEFRYSEPGEEGLAIIIWAAMGRNGEDIFDPALPVRRGEVMSDFHTGAINCYHTSYIARGRKTANLRKNYGFHVLTNGNDLSTVSKPDQWHVIRLEQCNGTIRLFFDGVESYRFEDDGTIGGPPITTGGKFAFRQQNNLHRGDYRNLRVYRLENCDCSSDSESGLPVVEEVDLAAIDPGFFTEEEWFVPYYLNHFAAVANSVADTGMNRGFFDLSVWRGTVNHHTYNARVMEGILSLVWFYVTDRPWNVYYKDPALKRRMEAALGFWCAMQNEDGRFSEYATERWGLAPTAFATKFLGRALWLLAKSDAPVDAAVFERARVALRKALHIGFTDKGLWEHGRNYTNQYANLWGGALLYLEVWPDQEIYALLKSRLAQSMTEFQSPAGFFYERGGPDWAYNLGTHHSNLQVAWEFAKGTELQEMIVRKTADWYEWFAYNAVKEPDSDCYYLNRAVETRQHKGYFLNMEIEDPANMRWTPQAEFVPEAHPFEMSETEYKDAIHRAYKKMRDAYPEVTPLNPGHFSAFSPYAFLHHNMRLWHSSDEQKRNAVDNLPWQEKDNFIHVRHDKRSETTYSYIRKPNYYAVFNSGEIITAQQRYGLGLVWNPETGTLLQSQSRTDVASYGTKATGNDQVYEAGDIFPQFKINSRNWEPVEGNSDLPPGELIVSYDLKDKGTKEIHFQEDKIVVRIIHEGNFTEILPLLTLSEDQLTVDDNLVTVQNRKGAMQIRIKNGTAKKPFIHPANLYEKENRVVEISSSGQLEYEFIFEKDQN